MAEATVDQPQSLQDAAHKAVNEMFDAQALMQTTLAHLLPGTSLDAGEVNQIARVIRVAGERLDRAIQTINPHI